MNSRLSLDDLVSRIKIYLSCKAPTSRNAKAFIDWIDDHKPLSVEEQKFIQRKDDFVALSNGQENGWLDGIVEDGLTWCLPLRAMKVRTTSLFSPFIHSFNQYIYLSIYSSIHLSVSASTLTTNSLRKSSHPKTFPNEPTTTTSTSTVNVASTSSSALSLSSPPLRY